MRQPIKVVMLPTKDISNLGKPVGILKYDVEGFDPHVVNNYHLYITVSQDVEPTEKGDWIYDLYGTDSVYQVKRKRPKWISDGKFKIIATTDPKLIGITVREYNDLRVKRNRLRDDAEHYSHLDYIKATKQIKEYDLTLTAYEKRLPQVQQSFLKEYVANPDREYAVEYESKYEYGKYLHNKPGYVYVVRLKLSQDNTVNITPVKEKISMNKFLEFKSLADAIIGPAAEILPETYEEEYKAYEKWTKENL